MKSILLSFLLIQLLGVNLFGLTFGVVPQQSPHQLMKTWYPIVKYLQESTGEKIVLKIEHSITEFEKNLYNGGYDFAYMNPYHYIIAHEKKGFIAEVRANKKLVGAIFVRKNSPINDISMIKGKIFLFPAPNAFAATILVKYELLAYHNINVDKDTEVLYVNSHNSVYKGVARKIGDLGGGIERTYYNFKDTDSKDSLKILYKTEAYPSHPFAFSPSVSENVREKVVQALLNLPKYILDSLGLKKMIRVDDSDFDAIRELAKKFVPDMSK